MSDGTSTNRVVLWIVVGVFGLFMLGVLAAGGAVYYLAKTVDEDRAAHRAAAEERGRWEQDLAEHHREIEQRMAEADAAGEDWSDPEIERQIKTVLRFLDTRNADDTTTQRFRDELLATVDAQLEHLNARYGEFDGRHGSEYYVTHRSPKARSRAHLFFRVRFGATPIEVDAWLDPLADRYWVIDKLEFREPEDGAVVETDDAPSQEYDEIVPPAEGEFSEGITERYQTCARCDSTRQGEVGQRWRRWYDAPDAESCRHAWDDGVSKSVQVSDGAVVLVRKGRAVGGFIIRAHTWGETETVSYDWVYRDDGLSKLDAELTGVEVGSSERQAHVTFGPFVVGWSAGGDGTGWLYYDHHDGDPLPEEPLRICVTSLTTLAGLNAGTGRWIYRASEHEERGRPGLHRDR